MDKLACALFFLFAACGGSSEPANTTPTNTPAPEAAPLADTEKHDHDHEFPGAVAAFHDVLSPLWHAEPGEARMSDTCDAMPALAEKAAGVIAAEPPAAAGDVAAWQASTEMLATKVTELGEICPDLSRVAEFDSAFKGVHDAFHALTDQVGDKK